MDLFGLYKRTSHDFTQSAGIVFSWQLIVQLLGLVAATPFVSWIANHIVIQSGSDVISNYDIGRFLLTPGGLLIVLLLTCLVTTFYTALLAGYSWISGHVVSCRANSIRRTVGAVTLKLPLLLQLGMRIFLRSLLLTMPFFGFVALIWFAAIDGRDINYYLAEQPAEWRRALLLFAVAGTATAAFLLVQFARWSFAIPILMFHHVTPKEALKSSEQMLKGRLATLLIPLLVWWGLIAIVVALCSGFVRALTDPALDWAGVDPERVLPLVVLFMTISIALSFLGTTLKFSGHQLLLTRLYCEQLPIPLRLDSLETSRAESLGARIHRPLWIGAVGLFLLAGAVLAYLVEHLDAPDPVAVTSHRGVQLKAVENTLSAFREAHESGAEYVELDVQRTRDGHVVVFHDGDLLRLAGDSRKVKDLTLAEIQALDLRNLSHPEWATERVPTLHEVIADSRGKVKLNIELKYNFSDKHLASEVIKLLRSERFLDQVVITSLDYAALKQVKEIEPSLVTGLIVTASIGNVIHAKTDFLSVNQVHITSSLVDMARTAGKSIHAWTANTPEAMLRMIEYDVENIITDNPATLMRIIRLRNSLSAQEQMGLRLRTLFTDSPPELDRQKHAPSK